MKIPLLGTLVLTSSIALSQPIILLTQDFNGGSGGFTVVNSSQMEDPWMYGTNAGINSGAWSVGGSQNVSESTSSALLSPTLLVTQSGGVSLSFDHRYSFEYTDPDRWDGGQVRLSVNGGPFKVVASFSSNGYDGFITGGNVLIGQPAFSSTSPGYSTPVYLQSVASLGGFAAGSTLRIQFLGAWDSSVLATKPNWVIDNVIVQVDPAAPILSGPVDQVAQVGDLVAMEAVASGNGPFTYQWFFNGGALAGATNGTLIWPSAKPMHQGIYHLLVRNGVTTVSSQSAFLTVASPLVIIDQPTQETAAIGDFAQFCMSLEDQNQPVTLQWRLNGVNIPGATDQCYDIDPIGLGDQGSYDCVISDGKTTVRTASAQLVIPEIPRPQPQDGFSSRIELVGAVGLVGGSNSNTTHQAGEPDHGKVGSKSVWYRWVAPANGVALFTTRGSGFDTLLAVYTGSGISSLTAKATDDDGIGSLNSQVMFNAQAGIEYQIAVDGFGGEFGEFALSWQLDTSGGALPEILTRPVGATVSPGDSHTLSVQASGGNLSYQWFFKGAPLANATQPSLTFSSVQPAQVGPYFVRITSGSRSVDSLVVSLEISSFLNVQSADKPGDLLSPSQAGGVARSALTGEGGGLPNSFVPVTAGSVGSHVMANTGARTSPGEPSSCGVIGGASQWFGLDVTDDGMLVVDTLGSDFDTVLAVYSGPAGYTDLILLQLALVACDNNGAGDGLRSRVAFAAEAGTHYYVSVDGVGSAQGTVQLHWQLAPAPILAEVTQRQLLSEGHDFILASSQGPMTGQRFQWQLNGTNLPSATSKALALWHVRLDQAGDYKLVTLNGTAALLSPVRPIAVAQLNHRWTPQGGGGMFEVSGRASHTVAFEETTDINQAWTPVVSTVPPMQTYQVSRTVPSGQSHRLVRVRLLP